MTPVLKASSGAPYGATSRSVRARQRSTNCSNYGTQLVLAEPIGTRRQDNVVVLDFRVEKQIPFAARGKSGCSRTCSTR